MNDLPRDHSATIAGWSDFIDELDRWGEAGHVATLWWRDDDAVAATPRLDHLLRLAGEVPLALAAIPAKAGADLAAALDRMPQVAVLQHGWRHANHMPEGARKSEFPAGRAAAAVAAELAAGGARLAALFGPRALPVLVPPWNRFDAAFLPLLGDAGIAGLSAMAAREGTAPCSCGVQQIDVHVDLVAWRQDRGFIGMASALGGVVGHLRARRLGPAGRHEATGILTHHLVMDRATADFVEELAALVEAHGAARWAGAGELLGRR